MGAYPSANGEEGMPVDFNALMRARALADRRGDRAALQSQYALVVRGTQFHDPCQYL